MQSLQFRAMGCQMKAFIDNEGHAAALALAQVPGWFEEWEQALSRFRPTSELSRLNERGGQVTPVSETMLAVLHAALAAAHWSGGLVAPTLLQSMQRAGYDRSFELIGQAGGSRSPGQDLEPPAAADAWQAIVLDEEARTVWLPVGVKLDFGGVAKGWAAQQAAGRLKEFGPALVDAGGDIAVSGPQTGGHPWPVSVADPLQNGENLATLMLAGCGVATSGIDFRRWVRDGAWKHHIIDPRTGEPAETDLMSVTVAAEDILMAETAAKCVLILGSQEGQAWLETIPYFSAVLALQDGRVLFPDSSPG